ncbi:hypothetical protein HKCCE3408_00510 [Rhodobacterales bacterium HKCCE3408]|nr:hypothetical protein [Rhodobacterales bacterium HKCCE3408]
MNDGDQGRTSRTMIEAALKRIYRDALEEDVPDRFRDLIARLREQDTGRDTQEADRGIGERPSERTAKERD